MKNDKELRGRARRATSSPSRNRHDTKSDTESPTRLGTRRSKLSPSAALVDAEVSSNREYGTRAILSGDSEIYPGFANSDPNPRSFPYSVKQKCWDKAEKVKGRDPDRWRRDALGNIVFKKLVGCPGCLCHDYDHILPYSKVMETIISRNSKKGWTSRFWGRKWIHLVHWKFPMPSSIMHGT